MTVGQTGRSALKSGRRSNAAPPSRPASAFTLIEVMVVVVLMALIVVALMAVFNGTQTAFRAGLTQSDVLESGRAAMDLMATDLREMSPSLDVSNTVNGAVNFTVEPITNAPPLLQPLTASSPAESRTNVAENFFILSRGNQNGVPTWFGVAYVVFATNSANSSLYSLYRFATNCPVAAADAPHSLFHILYSYFSTTSSPTNGSHLMDGVVELRVRAYDVNGGWMTNQVVPYGTGAQYTTNENVVYQPTSSGETSFGMFSNALPAAVEIEMGALEDRTLQRAATWPNNSAAQNNYLAGCAGQVHVFRQRISIPNVDPSAYQP